MKRTIVLLAFNIVISLVAIVPLSMVGFVFELAGFPEIQISDITTTIGMAIATALTIHYGYRKGYMRRSDFSYNLSGFRQAIPAFCSCSFLF